MDKERREYFRITETLGYSYRILEDATITQPYDPKLPLPPTLTVMNQIRELQQESQLPLKTIQSKQANIGRYLKNLNLRMELVESAIFGLDTSYPELTWLEACYSETGIDFVTHEQIAENIRIHLYLGLPDPKHEHRLVAHNWLSIIAVVRSCRTKTDNAEAGWNLGVEFESLTDIDRQCLARHIMQVQSTRRRASLDAEP